VRLSSSDITREALHAGFDLCGVAPARDLPELGLLRDWLDSGRAGEMRYLERDADRRSDVRRVLPSARSVIVAAMNYNVGRPCSTQNAGRGRAGISRYAWGEDYHEVMGRALEDLLAWMKAQSSEPFEAKCYVDTGPVLERVYALYAGLGWIGKNTCLINPEIGSWLFLSEIIVSLELQPAAPEVDHCGTCGLCLEACPTGALVEPHVLDARRCISYLTIELKGAIPEGPRDLVGTHVYGCDICQDVCPWNQRPAISARAEWLPRPRFDGVSLVRMWRMTDNDLRTAMRHSAMSRARLRGIRRNLAVALGNSGLREALDALEAPLDGRVSASKSDPVVREHVDWARRKLRTVGKREGWK
jgi:epoxyqueuosine reductase